LARLECVVLILGVVDLAQRRLRAGVRRRLRQGGKHVAPSVEPAALLADDGEHRADGLAEAQCAVTDREDWRGHPAPPALPQPLIADVVAVIAARHPRVRAMSLDRGQDDRYDDAIELLLASLMALGEDGQFGDTFARPTTTPMLLDRAVVFDVSAIDTAELTLGPDRPIKPTGHGQNEAPDTVGFLGEAGRPQFGVPMEPRLSVRCKSRRRSGGWRRHP